MSDLWSARRAEARRAVEPLAVRMRPRKLDEVVGQTHMLGEGKLLRRMIEADAVMSLILHGPPGTGKTTLAEVIAGATGRRFVRENAASVGVKRIREIIDDAGRVLGDNGRRTILFLDEIHRFTKSQQDVLLGDVERGLITLIGATTENPLFAVNSALISRSTLFRLEPLTEDEIIEVLRRAISDVERGYGRIPITADEDALRVWAIKSEGDARRALTALEVAVESSQQGRRVRGTEKHRENDELGVAATGLGRGSSEHADVVAGERQPRQTGSQAPLVIDVALAEASIQQKVAVYGDDGHYDAASAMIKSVRGGDPDAAVYWIARMLDAGEDPRFIARRLAILASEDIGNADPRAITLAASAWELVERIGMPEARITLSQCACYLALAPKSNASYLAIDAALKDVAEGRVVPVPQIVRDPNSGNRATDEAGRSVMLRQHRRAGGERYEYSHQSEHRAGGTGITGDDYLGVERRYYEPIESGEEAELMERLQAIRALRTTLREGEQPGGARDVP
ncbi:MAG: replication-associated recombination protein A [Planctomycetota bacterium]